MIALRAFNGRPKLLQSAPRALDQARIFEGIANHSDICNEADQLERLHFVCMWVSPCVCEVTSAPWRAGSAQLSLTLVLLATAHAVRVLGPEWYSAQPCNLAIE